MASKAPPIRDSRFKDILTCSICLEPLTDPKVLPCLHTFCLGCVDTWATKNQTGKKLPCPICKEEMVVPEGGSKAIKPNFLLNTILDVLQSTPEEGYFCDVCNKEGEKVTAHSKCLDCSTKLCDRCFKVHSGIELLKEHQTMELTGNASVDISNTMKVITERSIYCEKHPREALKFYCKDDNCVICMACHVTSHSGHSCSDIYDEVLTDKEKIQKLLDITSLRCTVYRKNLDQTRELKLKEFDELKQKINQDCKQLHAYIDSHTDKQLEILSIEKQSICKTFEKLEIETQDIAKSKEFLQSLLSHGHAVEILRMRTELTHKHQALIAEGANRFEDIQVSGCSYSFQQGSVGQACLTLAKLVSCSTGVDEAGTTKVEETPKQKESGLSNPTSDASLNPHAESHITDEFTFPGNCPFNVTAIAVQQNGDVVIAHTYRIAIYNSSLSKLKSTITCASGYTSIVALGESYIMFLDTNSVITLYNVQNHSLRKLGEGAKNLGVFPNKHVAILDNVKITCIDCYTGRIQCYVKVNMMNPSSMTVNSKYIVIIADSGKHIVQGFSMVSQKAVLSYGTYGEGIGQLIGPKGVCTDHQDNIIIADSGNKRVHLIDSKGNFVRYLLQCVDSPISVAIKKDGQLLCGTDKGKIYTIKYNLS